MIYDKASLVQIPSGYKSGTLYSVVPNTADGDFTVTGDPEGEATRVNKDGLIETVAADVPRLNYPLLDGVVQDCPTLLLEPTRANSLSRSEEFNLWGDTGVTVTANATIAPRGAQTADLLTSSANNWRRSQAVTIANGSVYSFSCFVKKHTTTNKIRFELYKGSNASNLDFVFSTETLSASDASLTDLKVENYPNDWYRVSCKFTANGTNAIVYLYPSQGYGSSGSAYFWGAQLEAGDYPTSYIPTSGSAVTRTADTCNIANYTNLPTDYPLTVYWKGQVKEFNGSNCAFSIYKDGATGEFLAVSFQSSSLILVRRAFGGSDDIDFISHSYSLGDVLKIGIKFTSATTFNLFIDGLEIYEETSGVSKTWDFNSVLIGQLRVAADTGNRNPCDALMLFNEALSDSELETITSYTSFNQMAKALLYTIE
jgi:hypothetical protein